MLQVALTLGVVLVWWAAFRYWHLAREARLRALRPARSYDYGYGPAWRARSRRYLREHGYRCEACGWRRTWWTRVLRSPRHVETHHRRGKGHPANANGGAVGYEADDDLVALCSGTARSCHTRVHERHRRRYLRRGLDGFPYAHLEHVTRTYCRHAWWRRTLRGSTYG